MTHRPVKVLADGTHVYKDYHRYKPMPDHLRKNKVRRPDDPRAVRWGGQWLLPLDLLPDEQRVMPETRPDSDTLEHRAWCTCEVCSRPEAAILWRRRAKNLYRTRPGSSRQRQRGSGRAQDHPRAG